METLVVHDSKFIYLNGKRSRALYFECGNCDNKFIFSLDNNEIKFCPYCGAEQ